MNTKQIGQITESRFVFECAKHGTFVSQPIGDNAPYDFIVDIEGKLLRVQCKTLRKAGEGVYKFNVKSTTGHRNNQRAHDYHGKVDYFFAYNLEDDIYVIIPIDEVKSSEKVVRTVEPKNGQLQGICFVDDHQAWF